MSIHTHFSEKPVPLFDGGAFQSVFAECLVQRLHGTFHRITSQFAALSDIFLLDRPHLDSLRLVLDVWLDDLFDLVVAQVAEAIDPEVGDGTALFVGVGIR